MQYDEPVKVPAIAASLKEKVAIPARYLAQLHVANTIQTSLLEGALPPNLPGSRRSFFPRARCVHL